MSDASVLGAGAMGGAMVRALAAAGREVTVWNRTPERATALVGATVAVADTVEDALTASPLAILSVADHDIAHALLDRARADLSGTTVVSLSFASPERAGGTHELLAGRGGRCLDVAVAAYPRHIGTDAAHLLVSGDEAAFERHRPRLADLGTVVYVGASPGAAFVTEMAAMLWYLPTAVGLLQGARICELHDVSLDRFAQTVRQVHPVALTSLLERIVDSREPSGPTEAEATIEVWAQGAAEYGDHLAELGFDTGIYDALRGLFRAAVAAGHGQDDWIGVGRFATGREAAATQPDEPD